MKLLILLLLLLFAFPATIQAQVLVSDTFDGASGAAPDAARFDWGGDVTQNGVGQVSIQTWTAHSSWLRSKTNATLNAGATLVLQMRAYAYAEGTSPGVVYGDYQPRGLRVVSDANNVVEFYSATRTSVGMRVRKAGTESSATYSLPAGVDSMHDYQISVTTTSAVFKVDGVLAGTFTNNIPTGALNFYASTYYAYSANIPVTLDSLVLSLTNNGPQLPPTVVTSAPGNLVALGINASATLNGSVNPNGATTTAWFAWGVTTNYGSNTSLQSMGSGSNALAVSALLTNLSVNTVYHYCLVTTNAGGSTNGADQVLDLPSLPRITSFSPGTGIVGTAVSIVGTNFSNLQSVRFNGTPVESFSYSSSQIDVAVPAGASSGPVGVTTLVGATVSTNSFTVIQPPIITAFAPTSGPVGTVITISGTNLSIVSGVKLNGGTLSYSVVSDLQITATIPAAALSGSISVTNPAGTATSSGSFQVTRPVVTLTNADESALNQILTNGGTAVFNFDGVVNLTTTNFIVDDVTLDGSGHNVTLNGSNLVRLLSVSPGARLTLRRLTLAGGTDQMGGAVNNNGGWVTAVDCLFTNNVAWAGADGSSGFGGAIYNGTNGTLILSRCSFVNNRASGQAGAVGGYGSGTGGAGGNAYGGAIYNTASLLITNCTFYGNQAFGGAGGTGGQGYNGYWYTCGWPKQCLQPGSPGGQGGPGGQAFGGNVYFSQGTGNVVNATIAVGTVVGGNGGSPGLPGNYASGNYGWGASGTGAGGNLAVNAGSLTLQNSIVANPYAGLSTAGPVADGGNNICSDSSCSFTNASSFNSTSPQITGSPTDNGGFTPTIAIPYGSPAMNAGNDAAAPVTDQRGMPRLGRSDIGAYEIQPIVPAITIQPTNQTVAAGSSPAFTVAAIGTDPLAYQWSFNGATLPNATNSTLALAAVDCANKGNYTVLITNTWGSVTSSVAALDLSNRAPVANSGGPYSILYGNGVTLNGSASSDPDAACGDSIAAYDWDLNLDGVADAQGVSPTLTHAALNGIFTGGMVGAHTIRLTVIDSQGATGQITTTLTIAYPPAITSPPASVTNLVGTTASFSVTANGDTPLSYQWRKDGGDMSSATNATLTLNNVQTNQAGNYTVLITNIWGSVTSSVAAMTVNRFAQTINFDSLSGKRVDDAPFSLGATASSGLPVSYTNSNPAVATVSGNTVNITGIGSTVITALQAGNETYLPAGNVNQTLTVAGIPPGISSQPTNLTVNVTSNATFSVTATGTAPFAYQWRKDDVDVSGATNATLTLNNVQTNQVGNYTVLITSTWGNVTSSVAALTVLVPLPFTYITNADNTITITSYTGSGGDVIIPDTINGLPVIKIGNNAFAFSRITSVMIPASVTTIDNRSFYECSSLTSITIPNSVTTIGDWAFSFDIGLTNVVIGNSVTSIGATAFYYCYGLTSVTIPNSVTSIGGTAFSQCSGLTSMTIPNSVVTIGNQAFYYCTALTNVTIGNSVTTIGDNMFTHCTGLTSVMIPNSVTMIGNSAFSYCSGLTNVTLGNSVRTIGVNAFSDNASLASLTIPNSVTSIGESAFSSCASLTSVIIPNSVTSMGYGAFSYDIGLANVVIGNGITSIADATFYSCSGLTRIYFRGNAPGLGGSSVFTGATSCTVYRLPNASGWPLVPDLWGGRPTAIWDLPYLLTVNNGTGSGSYTNGVQATITASNAPAGQLFDRWTGATQTVANVLAPSTTLTMPTQDVSVTAIYRTNDFTFTTNAGTITITGYIGSGGAVVIPDTMYGLPVAAIANYAFLNNSTPTNIVLPGSITSIGWGAFMGCTNLTEIIIPEGVTSIGGQAFYICNLTNVVISASVTSIGMLAFSHNPNLAAITVDDLNDAYKSVDGVLFNKTQTVLVECPEAKAGFYAITNGVETVAETAFFNCTRLTGIQVPGSVASLGSQAFSYCPNLSAIYFRSNAPSVGLWVFNNSWNVTVYHYSASSGWPPVPDLWAGQPTALWGLIPQVPPGSSGVVSNRFSFTINWQGMQGDVVVEACTNLASPDWQPVSTNTLTGGTAQFSDREWTNHSGRFYRLRSP